MYDEKEFLSSVPPGTAAEMVKLPYDVARKELYTAGELFGGFDPEVPGSIESCLDSRIAKHVERVGDIRANVFEQHMRSMHDAYIRTALYRLLNWYEEKRVVGIMGGHSLLRTDECYRRVVTVAKELTERGYLMISGGGPGAMEATHVGAYLAGRPSEDADAALDMLADSPSSDDPGWLASAFGVMKRFPQDKGFVSVSVPTWSFASEPPAPFATHIAKFFENSLREDVLLAEAYGGVIFMPGSAGTLQEVFQDAVQNHYVTLGYPSPMVFVGRRFWTETMPVYPLFEKLASDGLYRNLKISLAETPAEIVMALSDGQSSAGGDRRAGGGDDHAAHRDFPVDSHRRHIISQAAQAAAEGAD